MESMARRLVLPLLAAALFAHGSINIALAEERTFTAQGNTIVSERETINEGKVYAVENAKANACLKAGVFVAGHAKVKNGMLDADGVEVVTSNAIKVMARDFQEPIEEIIRDDSVAYNIVANITAVIDTSDLEHVVAQYLVAQNSLTYEERRQQKAARAGVKALLAEKAAAEEANKNDLLASQKLLAANLLKQVVDLEGIGYTEQALSLLDAIEKLGIDDVEIAFCIHGLRGDAYYYLGQYAQTVSSYSQALALNSAHAQAYLNRGTAYHHLGQYDRALADYDQAIALAGGSASAYNNKGCTYESLGQYDKAIGNYDKAIALDSMDAMAYHNRGLAYCHLKQYDQALADFSRAIELDGRFSAAYYDRGVLYDNLQQHEQAIADYSQAIALNDRYTAAYYNRGLIYSKLKQYNRAIVDYTAAIALDDQHVKARYSRGVAYYVSSQNEKAYADFSRVIELDSGYQSVYVYRGYVCIELKRYEQALADFQKYLSFNLNEQQVKLAEAGMEKARALLDEK